MNNRILSFAPNHTVFMPAEEAARKNSVSERRSTPPVRANPNQKRFAVRAELLYARWEAFEIIHLMKAVKQEDFR